MTDAAARESVAEGQRWKAKTGQRIIVIGKRHSGNRHWNTYPLGGGRKAHRIHEGTLRKFYERVG